MAMASACLAARTAGCGGRLPIMFRAASTFATPALTSDPAGATIKRMAPRMLQCSLSSPFHAPPEKTSSQFTVKSAYTVACLPTMCMLVIAASVAASSGVKLPPGVATAAHASPGGQVRQ